MEEEVYTLITNFNHWHYNNYILHCMLIISIDEQLVMNHAMRIDSYPLYLVRNEEGNVAPSSHLPPHVRGTDASD